VTATVPALTKPPRPRKLRSDEAVLDNGLRVVAVRKPGVPIVEMRLRIPFLSAKSSHPARAALLSDALATGAGGLDRAGIAAAVQALGADISVGVDADRLMISGNVLGANLGALLDIVGSLVTDPAYERDEVATERDRLVERLGMARARPGVVASEALAHRMWGEHPYAVDLPQPEAVAEVTRAQLRTLHEKLVRPAEAVLILVGDLPTRRMLDAAASALAAWSEAPKSQKVPSLPDPPSGPLLVVDRPGSVQTSVRLGRAGLPRVDPDYPALQLANLIFGGYFSSRWTENIREDKGYTYGPHSRVEHHVLGSTVGLDVEVATEVTAPAMLETYYELGRLASLPVTQEEVDSVRQYAIGNLALSTATQAGLASTLSAFGLGIEWITEHPGRLLTCTVDDVSAAAARFFGPAGFTSVVVGDAETIAGPLASLGAIEQ
jgi:predicted Zn-dependent peptidase